MIINVRGTSGSGKTFTTRSFMQAYGPDSTVLDDEGKVIAHVVYYHMVPVYFIGQYTNVCGGCDTIDTQDMACSLVRHFSQFGHVIFEGLIMSHSFARYKALHDELKEFGIPMVFAYMDTPLEICLKRVENRRLDRGNTKKFNPSNTIDAYSSSLGTKDKFDQVGINTIMINHKKDPVAQIEALLDRDKGMEFENSYREESFR